MRLLLALLLLPAGPALAMRVAKPFPAAYIHSVSLSLGSAPLYGSQLLQSFQSDLSRISAMNTPGAVCVYLESRASPMELKKTLGAAPLSADSAAAVLLANALVRPDQFQKVVTDLESLRPGLGGQVKRLLSEARGTGDPQLLGILRSRGQGVKAMGLPFTYDGQGQFDRFFDGSTSARGDVYTPSVSAPEVYTGYGPDGKPLPSGLSPAHR